MNNDSKVEKKFATREQYLQAALKLLQPLFDRTTTTIPPVKVATGWPSSRGLSEKRRVLGECWSKDAAADGESQIFISPWIDDVVGPQGVLSTLAHEAIHAAVGHEAKHGPKFRRVALGIGLEGKMTATHAGEKLLAELKSISDHLGPFPHCKLDGLKSPKKKQSTRMVKCECETCGYVARTSKKWLDDVGAPHCPKHGAMKFDPPSEDEPEDGESETEE